MVAQAVINPIWVAPEILLKEKYTEKVRCCTSRVKMG